MRTKQVQMHYCEYCGKRGMRAYYIREHEKHCTLNPNRECRVCGLIEEQQPRMADLLALLPRFPHGDNEIYTDQAAAAVEALMPALRNAANNCPACIMAALRQAGIPVPIVESFDFSKEMASIWKDFNTARAEDGGY